MFIAYQKARKKSRRPHLLRIAGLATVGYAASLVVLMMSADDMHAQDLAGHAVQLFDLPPPPPPPAASTTVKKKKKTTVKKKKIKKKKKKQRISERQDKVKVEKTKPVEPEPEPEEEETEPVVGGVEGGVAGGVAGGVVGGVIGGKLGGSLVPPKLLVKAQRKISGNPPRYPPSARGKALRATVVVRICISTSGKVTAVRKLSGAPPFDQSVTAAVKHWIYEPFQVDGRPTPACFPAYFHFKIRK